MAEIIRKQKFQYRGRSLGIEKGIEPYMADPRLVEAVNLSILLQRPLLLKGEPGCGKTKLASDVARELDVPFETWYVKSTSKARDGLYSFDFIGRLRDAQLASVGVYQSIEDVEKLKNPSSYLRLGPLGKSFVNHKFSVVLIDEIDKADIDFPNDLLIELDEKKFVVEETGQQYEAPNPPLVIITSNDEKELPDAFLRRCLFYYIEFPSKEKLIEIVKAHFPPASDELVEKSVTRFVKLRETLRSDRVGSTKSVSTSELLDWFHVLNTHPEDEVLSQLDGELPYLVTLLKNWDDHLLYYQQQRAEL